MWTQAEKPRVISINKGIAREWANMTPAPHDRPLSEPRIQIYKKAYGLGTFRGMTWAKVWCEETQTTYRVNGKHTSNLFSVIDLEPGKPVYATIEYYTCETLNEVAEIYATFDSREGMRSIGDINRTFAATHPKTAEMPLRIVNMIIGGIAYHKYGDRYTHNQSAAERAEALLDNIPFAEWANGILSGSKDNKSKRHIYRQPVVSAMYSTWLKNKSEATTFWEAVRDETGEKPELPDRLLAKYLTTHSLKEVQDAHGRNVPSREFYSRCIHGWNAYRGKGRKTLTVAEREDASGALRGGCGE